MSNFVRISILITVSLLSGCKKAEQPMPDAQRAAVEETVKSLTEQSIAACEKVDIDGVAVNVSDKYNTGFIDNGVFYPSFESLIADFRIGFGRLKSQEIKISDRRITVLAPNVALVTAHGNFTATDKTNNTFKGNFAWTFVYAKIGDEWKIIHSHQSSPG